MPVDVLQELSASARGAEERLHPFLVAPRGHPSPLTMTEIMARPETFTAPDLLVNTGMLLVDMRADWVESIFFTIKDRIDKSPNGAYTVVCEPEDWGFSRQARRLRVQLWATQRVRLIHMGPGYYNNFQTWGTDAHDVVCEAKGRDMSPLMTSGPPTREALSR